MVRMIASNPPAPRSGLWLNAMAFWGLFSNRAMINSQKKRWEVKKKRFEKGTINLNQVSLYLREY